MCRNPAFCCFCGREGHVSMWCPDAVSLSGEGRAYTGSHERPSAAVVEARFGLPAPPMATPIAPPAPPALPNFGLPGQTFGGFGGVAPSMPAGEMQLSAVLAQQAVSRFGQIMDTVLQKQQVAPASAPAPFHKRKRATGPSEEEIKRQKEAKEAQKQANIERDRAEREAAAERREARRREGEERAAAVLQAAAERRQAARDSNRGAQGRYERDLESLVGNFLEFSIDRRLQELETDIGGDPREELQRLRDRTRTLAGLWVSERRADGHIQNVNSFFSGERAGTPPADVPEDAEEDDGGDKPMDG